MTEIEHLLVCLNEECAEVSQRVSKALRFGLDEVQPGQSLTNAERIVIELADIQAIIRLLERKGAFKAHGDHFLDLIDAKQIKVENFMKYAESCGTLDRS